jgi:hypothetical protein
MRNKILFITIYLICCTKILSAQSDNKIAVKMNFSRVPDYSSIKIDTSNNYYQTKNNRLSVLPSIVFKNKKKNYWEIQIDGGKYKYNYIVKDINSKIDSSNLLNDKDNFFRFNIYAINHIDLLKKTNSKLRFLLSFNYKLGYENFSRFPVFNNNVAFDINEKYLYSEFGMSTRIGYNISKSFYFEVRPPLFFNLDLALGRHFFYNNPSIPKILRNQTVFNLNIDIPFNSKLLSTSKTTELGDIFSIAYRF